MAGKGRREVGVRERGRGRAQTTKAKWRGGVCTTMTTLETEELLFPRDGVQEVDSLLRMAERYLNYEYGEPRSLKLVIHASILKLIYVVPFTYTWIDH